MCHSQINIIKQKLEQINHTVYCFVCFSCISLIMLVSIAIGECPFGGSCQQFDSPKGSFVGGQCTIGHTVEFNRRRTITGTRLAINKIHQHNFHAEEKRNIYFSKFITIAVPTLNHLNGPTEPPTRRPVENQNGIDFRHSASHQMSAR